VQILHIAGCHWAVVSNVDVREGGCHRDAVGYYDSMRTLSIGLSTRKVVCSFFKCKFSTLNFDLVDVMHQPNADDCGIFALAMATELAYDGDPAVCKWDVETMRQHLLKCLEVGKIERFP